MTDEMTTTDDFYELEERALLARTAKRLDEGGDHDCLYTVMEDVHSPIGLGALQRFANFVQAPDNQAGIASRIWHWYDSTRPEPDEPDEPVDNVVYARWVRNRRREVSALLRQCAAIQED